MKACTGRRRRGWSAFFLTLLLLFYPSAPSAFSAKAETKSVEQEEGAAQTGLDEILKAYRTLGACVCVIENGEITYTFCYGLLSPDGAPVTQDTLFRVGSISKMVTAIGVMQLVETGKATLDGDISDLIGFTLRNPQYPDTPVTLRQVMCHTAGLRDSGFYALALRGNARTLTELFSSPINKYAFTNQARPGTKMDYSNFGGGLLGVLLENLTGQMVDDYMTKAVFAPLGITAAYRGALLPEAVAVSDIYAMPSGKRSVAVREDTEAAITLDTQLDYTLTAGKLTLSAPDLAKLLIALCDGGVYRNVRLLTETSCVEMRTPQNGVGSVTCDSGWGLDMNIVTDALVAERTLCGHGGRASGMLCAAYFDPEDRTGVVMLTNGCNDSPAKSGISKLSIKVIEYCYSVLIDSMHVTQDPWLVDD